jgi:hypothetical protein
MFSELCLLVIFADASACSSVGGGVMWACASPIHHLFRIRLQLCARVVEVEPLKL